MSTSSPVSAPIPAPRFKAQLEKVHRNIASVVRGKDAVIEDTLVCLLAGGHLLVEDLPGLGKTTLAYCLARSLDGEFSRIQFTADLLPGDVLGVSIYQQEKHEFVFHPGPVFANIVLADEINRATPKTQSALLEVMDRAKVTVDGRTHPVSAPFMVFATQNPVDYESTFPLPESQLDRFLLRLHMGYPDQAAEMEILRSSRRHYDQLEIAPVLTRDELATMQAAVSHVFIEDSVLEYLLRIVTATRTEAEFRAGLSTRASLALKSAAQARALLSGRTFVMPDDIHRMVRPVCAHRLGLRRPTADTLEERAAVEGVLSKILAALPQPV